MRLNLLMTRTYMTMRRLLPTVLASALPCLVQATPLPPAGPVAGQAACSQPGEWLIPSATPTAAAAKPIPVPELLDQLARKPVVLLGEIHDCADDHHWQLSMLIALHQRHPDMAIGFEMFPRRLQPALDRWVAGQLSEDELLRQTQWDEVWGFDPQLYLPLFRFARQNHLPMLAMNVDQALVRQVRTAGWDAVPEARREGVSRPADPTPSYREELQHIFNAHPNMKDGDQTARFAHFVEAQTLWDRAMAEAITRYRQAHPQTLVVGILGAGHVQHGYGVPHQLQALGLGLGQLGTLITLPSDQACAEISPGLADAVFVIPPQPERGPPPPRLGVSLQPAADGVMIEKVLPGSLAERTGLKDGDVILQAAGNKVSGIEDVRGPVQRQPPGTWLPLLIRRGATRLEIVVRFPAVSGPAMATPHARNPFLP